MGRCAAVFPIVVDNVRHRPAGIGYEMKEKGGEHEKT